MESEPLHRMGISVLKDPTIRQCMTYICNYPFSDVLDPYANQKFPGTLAVSISRSSEDLRGHNGHHLKYDATDILSWTNPCERQVTLKPVMLQHAQQLTKQKDQESFSHTLENLDFGGADDLFDIHAVLCVPLHLLDFGNEDELFRF